MVQRTFASQLTEFSVAYQHNSIEKLLLRSLTMMESNPLGLLEGRYRRSDGSLFLPSFVLSPILHQAQGQHTFRREVSPGAMRHRLQWETTH